MIEKTLNYGDLRQVFVWLQMLANCSIRDAGALICYCKLFDIVSDAMEIAQKATEKINADYPGGDVPEDKRDEYRKRIIELNAQTTTIKFEPLTLTELLAIVPGKNENGELNEEFRMAGNIRILRRFGIVVDAKDAE